MASVGRSSEILLSRAAAVWGLASGIIFTEMECFKKAPQARHLCRSGFQKKLPRRFRWNECLRSPAPFILSPGRGNSFRWFLVLRISVRPIQLETFSKERRTILPLLGERAGVRAEVILASMMSWLHPKSPVSRPVTH